jgi:hypothetical protein
VLSEACAAYAALIHQLEPAIGVGVAYRGRKLPIGLKLDIGRCQGPTVKRDAPRNRRKLGAILAAASDEANRDEQR